MSRSFNEWGYEVPPPAHDLKLTRYEGADAFYEAPSSFQRAMGKYPDRTMPRAARGKIGTYLKNVDPDEPGPGAYGCGGTFKGDRGLFVGKPPAEHGGRIKFQHGEGADVIYAAKSSFECSQPAHHSTFGSSSRFVSSSSSLGAVVFGAYDSKTVDEVPGPGQYNASPPASPNKAPRIAPPGAGSQERLCWSKTPGMGDSPGPIYNLQKEHKPSAVRGAPSSSFGTSRRFQNTPLDRSLSFEDSPGPGAYDVAPKRHPPAPAASARRPQSARGGPEGRLSFAPSEGAEPSYRIPSQFDKYAGARPSRPSSSMGGQERFRGKGSASDEPGPGAYEVKGMRPKSAPVARRGSVGSQRSLALTPWVDAAVDKDVPGPMYNIPSQFDGKGKAAVVPRAQRFTESDKEGPGPGAYTVDKAASLKYKGATAATFAAPRMRPPGWRPGGASRDTSGTPGSARGSRGGRTARR